MTIPADPFNRTRLPAAFDREGRIQLLGEVASALLAGQPVPREGAAFVAGAILSWLDQGGRLGALERDFLRVTGVQRSRKTPAKVWARCCANTATCDDAGETMESSSTTDEGSL